MPKGKFAAHENGHSESTLRLSAAHGRIKLRARYSRNSYRRKTLAL
jgi:hypothetical protein